MPVTKEVGLRIDLCQRPQGEYDQDAVRFLPEPALPHPMESPVTQKAWHQQRANHGTDGGTEHIRDQIEIRSHQIRQAAGIIQMCAAKKRCRVRALRSGPPRRALRMKPPINGTLPAICVPTVVAQ